MILFPAFSVALPISSREINEQTANFGTSGKKSHQKFSCKRDRWKFQENCTIFTLVTIRHGSYCCGVSEASEQQHNQDLRRISKKGVLILEFITFYQNALHLTRLHCATFYHSALRHELHEDVMPSSRVDSSEKSFVVAMFCSDLPVKRCEGDSAWLS